MTKTILSLMTISALALPLTAFSHDSGDMPGVIHVTASATADATPDRASVSAGVLSEATTAQGAMAANSEMMRNVFAALKAAGIPQRDIATSSLNLSPRYNYEDRRNGQPTITGYQAGNRVTITTYDLDRTGHIIDAMLQAGVNNIDGVSFIVSEPDEAQARARTYAIGKARVKAQDMARAADVRLGRLLSMREGSSPGPVGYNEIVVTGGRVARDSMAPPLSPGQREISSTVTLTYTIAD